MNIHTSGRQPPSPAIEELERHLDAWARASLITPAEAEAIRRFEEAHEGGEQPSRVPLVTEALAYLGAGLAAAAGIVVLTRVWDDLAVGVRIVLPFVLAVLLFAGGRLLRDAVEPAFERLGRVLWLLSVGAVAWGAGIVAHDGLEVSGRWIPVWVGAATTVYGGALFFARPHALQQLGLFGGILTLGAGLVDHPPTAVGLTIWAIGIAWFALAWGRRLSPRGVGLSLGTLAALYGPIMIGEWGGVGIVIGLVTAAGIMGASVPLRHGALLAIGAIAVFANLWALIVRYLSDAIGLPLALLLVGVGVLVVALVVARLRPMTVAGARPAR